MEMMAAVFNLIKQIFTGFLLPPANIYRYIPAQPEFTRYVKAGTITALNTTKKPK
jgi:hypothetical protein